MKDFNFKIYTQLLQSLQNAGFFFQTFAEYITQVTIKNPESNPPNHASTHTRKIILRHDVEARYENALQMARIQHKMGIKGSYYFRFLPKSYSSEIIKEIADLGHEIGYHYDDLSACNGNRAEALKRFQQHLEELRKIAPVQTMTMEGAPLSKYDNRDLWKPETSDPKKGNGVYQQRTPNTKHGTRNTEHGTKNTEQKTPNKQPYNKYGILAEPYFDIDFNKMFYLTDTGRRWDGWKTSVRDKVPQQAEWVKKGLVFHSTKDIIQAIENGRSLRRAEVLEASGVEMRSLRCAEPVEVSGVDMRSSSGVDIRSSSGVGIRSSSGVGIRSSSGVGIRSSSGVGIRSSSGVGIRSSSGVGIRSSSGVEMPDQIMMTFHPQRWNDKAFPWLKELVIQNLKNQIKKLLIKQNS